MNGNEYDYVTRTSYNQGVLRKTGYVNQQNINEKGTWSLGLLQMDFFYRKNPWYAGQFVRKIVPKIDLDESAILFFTTVLNMQKQKLLNVLVRDVDSTFLSTTIQLPTKNGKIDFLFMEYFVAELEAQRVAELEAQRVAELEAYLTITGLEDYELTDEEKEVLETFSGIRWKEHRMGDLFDRVKTNKLAYKAKDLPKEPSKEYVLPALTSSFMNQGLNYYVPKFGATVLKNVVSLPSNSDVYRAYYQSRNFTVLSDSYAIKSKDSVAGFTPNAYLFSVSCINKVTDLPIYSYKNKLGGWNVVKNKLIQLPIDSSNKIDFEYMKVFTQAIKKLVIKDVVLYADEKISATRQVINPTQQFERINKDGLLSVAEDSEEYY